MKNNFYLALAFSIFLLTSCGSSTNHRVSTEQKISTPEFTATPEIAENVILSETPIIPETKVIPNTVRFAIVISDDANLRKVGNIESEVIDTIPEGTSLEVLRQKGAWFLVRVDEKTGWLHGNTIRYADALNGDEFFTETYTVPNRVEVQTYTYVPSPTYSTPVPTPQTIRTPAVTVDNYRSPIANGETDDEEVDDSLRQRTTPRYSPTYPTYTPSYNSSPGVERVRGYTRKNGTYVAPYVRTKRDSTTLNNFSTKGNINPYTGKRGSRKP